MQETQVLNQLLWLPLIFLSGATIPFTSLSKTVQHIALFLPATYLVHGLKNAIVNSFGPGKILLSLGSLSIWFLLTLFLSSQLFRWEPEAKIGRRAKLYVAATAIPFILLGVWEARYGRVIAEEKVTMQRVDDSEKSNSREKPRERQQSTDPSKLDDSKPRD
jgi:ABC-2 type transport system permease protein